MIQDLKQLWTVVQGTAGLSTKVRKQSASLNATELEGEGIAVRLIDAYSVKPIDAAGIAAAVNATDGKVIVAEDHWPQGGIGDAVLVALAEQGVNNVTFKHVAVTEMPGSGEPQELMDAAGITGKHIAQAVTDLAAP